MANKAKKGLEYFPCEVDLFSDIKVRKLIKYQSGKSISVYVRLLCIIYKNGYYIKWDNELPFTISEDTGFEEGYVSEVITCCLKVGLLSQRMFDEFSVLTSKGIQDRYTTICIHSKRKAIVSEFMVNNSEELPQSKVKESKVKESKGDLDSEFQILKSDFLASETWLQTIAMQFGKEMPELLQEAETFLTENIYLKEDWSKGLKEVKKHFISILKQGKEKNSAKKENGNTTSKTRDAINGITEVLAERGIDANKYFQGSDTN